VFIHGNSASSRAFSRQLDGPLGKTLRVIAVDLPGHGASDEAKDPTLYSLPGHARAVRAVVDALGLESARFVGWSLSGHVAFEMAHDLPEARGFLIFGALPMPIGYEPVADEAFLPHPAAAASFLRSS
jgi:pimeloyl-ACP methyl ester carboxylesterase